MNSNEARAKRLSPTGSDMSKKYQRSRRTVVAVARKCRYRQSLESENKLAPDKHRQVEVTLGDVLWEGRYGT